MACTLYVHTTISMDPTLVSVSSRAPGQGFKGNNQMKRRPVSLHHRAGCIYLFQLFSILSKSTSNFMFYASSFFAFALPRNFLFFPFLSYFQFLRMPRLNIDTIIIKPDFSLNALAVLRPSNELGQARVIRAKP